MDNYTSKSKILIVDDVSKNIQIVANILKEENYLMQFARSGQSALDLIDSNQFDLILLDVMMPEMDGYEVCRRIKANSKTQDIPIIFLTAKTDSESIVQGFDAGGVDYITKPFNTSELKSRVKTHISLKQAHEQLKDEIEERKRKEKQLIESEHLLKELNATKDKFFSIIAHDLKNPFNSLINFSDILLQRWEELDKAKIETIIRLIHKTSKTSYTLLENLLQWSRAQTGRLQWKPEKALLHSLIDENFAISAGAAKNKCITLRSDFDANLVVFADYNMITTVLRNLISNAIKFTPSGGEIKIEASLKPQNDEVSTREIEISVSDNGVGIETEVLEKLFKIESHYTTMGTSNEQGTGLGLVLCKEFVERNGGTISVKSALNQGSTFTFTVPAVIETQPTINKENVINDENTAAMQAYIVENLGKEERDELISLFDIAEKSRSLDNIKYFAEFLLEIDERSQKTVFYHFSTQLIKLVQNFRVEEIVKLLAVFQCIISNIHNQKLS